MEQLPDLHSNQMVLATSNLPSDGKMTKKKEDLKAATIHKHNPRDQDPAFTLTYKAKIKTTIWVHLKIRSLPNRTLGCYCYCYKDRSFTKIRNTVRNQKWKA